MSEITKSKIEAIFNKFNLEIFDGVLPPIDVVICNLKGFVGRLESIKRQDKFGNIIGHTSFVMKISSYLKLTENEVEDIVIHEMIHYYIAFFNIHDTSQHGSTFKSLMSQINQKYDRHVTISFRNTPQKETETLHNNNYKIICVSSLTNGNIGITKCSKITIFNIYKAIKRSYDIIKVDLYFTSNPFFDRFPCSRTPKIYCIPKDILEPNLTSAIPIYCDGKSIKHLR